MLADTNQVAKQTFSYDQYNNQTDVYEYDFGDGAPGPMIRRTHTDYLRNNPYQGNVDYAADLNVHIRNLPANNSVSDGSGVEISKTWFDYDAYGINGLPALQGCPGISQHDGGFHTGYGARGNLVKTTRLATSAPTYIYNHFFYDIAGNVVQKLDGRGMPIFVDFSDRFGAPGNNAQSNAGAPELAGGFSYAFATKTTNALGHTAYAQYDYYLGRVVTTEDANKVVSSIAYNDALDRPTQGIQARYVVGVGVPAVRRQTSFIYDDANRVITTTNDRDTFSDNILIGKAYYDGLGRTWRSAAYEGANWTIKDTRFDELGRLSQVSSPYRASDPGSALPPSGLWTTTNYDTLSRATRVTTPDGAHVDTAYSGNQVTVTDQAGKKRRSDSNAIGRLVKVTEDPGGLGHVTSYLYDALGNIRYVEQGQQKRWFAYDSVSRLIRVKTPEQNVNADPNVSYTDSVTGHNGWSMAYKYDESGNLKEKTDALNIKTIYEYDALNRNTTVDYSNTTVNPDIRRYYDNTNPGTYGKGRFWHDYSGGGNWSTDPNIDHTSIDSYDPLGRPLNKRQLFKRDGIVGPTYSINQTYDLAGKVKSVRYPSDHIVNYSHDQAGRFSGFSGNLGGLPSTYADTIGYNAAGQMIKERFGTNTPLYRNQHYNSRMQLVDTRLGDSATDEWNWSRGAIAFLYGTTAVNNWDMFASDTDNNGNLRRQLNYVPLAGGGYVISQLDDYTYDPLNRIATIREQQRNVSGQWSESVSQNYSYDQWGNRTLNLSGGGGGGDQETVWVDDALPAGAASGGGGGDGWNWVNSSPAPKSGSVSHISNIADWPNWSPPPYSGNVSHQSSISSGLHQHYYHSSPTPIPVRQGGTLYAYIYMDPVNPPQEVMLQWGAYNDGWEHRAYWGANILGWGTDGTASRRYMGPLPSAGGWVRLEVPASAVGLEGMSVNAMAFTLYGGRANWDLAGISGVNVWEEWVCSWNGWDYDCYWQQHQDYENFVLVDDSIPAGAVAEATDGDSWNWRGASNVDLVHQHFFYNASDTLQVSAGDKLFTWVYLDPANPPQQVMLQWHENANWDHRAYWGANLIGWGTDGTASRRYMGPLPAAGGWVKLEVPASAVGLEGKIVNGMAFTLYGGRAAWDKAGKITPPPPPPVVGPPINTKAYVVDATTNRLQPPSGSGTMQYDAAGNLEIDSYTSGIFQRFVYDGENRLVEVKNSAGVVVSRYVYDADGQRARRITGGQETWHIYGIGGELLAEYAASGAPSAPQKEYGYRNGQLLVVWDGSEIGDRQLQWLVQDHLGSTRMVVDRSGSLGGIRRHDFAPFGEEMSAGVGIRSSSIGYSLDTVNQKFGSKRRDTETGFDFFGARYYASIQGRFTSVDPSQVSIDIGNPQSWNRYSYTLNNPLAYIDHNGKWSTEIHERIIDMAFKGWSEKNIKIIKQASKDMDNPLYGGQNEDRSYQHAMKARKESSTAAEQRMRVYVLEKVNEARTKYKEGKIDEGVYAFGEGLHTLMDWTSPAHEGFQDWWLPLTPEGTKPEEVAESVSKSVLFYFMYKQHSAMESAISAERMGMATGMAFAYTSYVWSEEEAIIERGGTSPGDYADPYIQELRRVFKDEPIREAEAEYLYRVGVAQGKERFKRIIK